MPRIENINQNFPEWSELKFYEIISLETNRKIDMQMRQEKQFLFVCSGKCSVLNGNSKRIISGGDAAELKKDFPLSICNDSAEKNTIIIVGGNWENEIGAHGVFSMNNVQHPKNSGDSTSYWRNTDFDNHFHDCDEYWIFYEGRGIAVSEEKVYTIEPGVCIATKMGDHHDIPVVNEILSGIYFETTLKGKKRKGHLWNHSHSI